MKFFVHCFFLRCRMTLKSGRNGVLREPEVMQKDLGQSDTPSRRYDSTKSATLRFSPQLVFEKIDYFFGRKINDFRKFSTFWDLRF